MIKSASFKVRFSPDEAAKVREIVKENRGTISEFVRMCVNAQLAQEGDPEATKLLSAMFEKGIQRTIELRVKKAMRQAVGWERPGGEEKSVWSTGKTKKRKSG